MTKHGNLAASKATAASATSVALASPSDLTASLVVAEPAVVVISTVTEPGSVFGTLSAFDDQTFIASYALAEGGAPEHGTVSLDPGGFYSYTPEPGYEGPDSFTFVVTNASGETATATVTITVAEEAPLTIDGSTAADVLIGGTGDNVIQGLGGPGYVLYGDLIYGGEGHDSLIGGVGREVLYGGNGNDVLDVREDGGEAYGGEGNDTLTGGSGDDAIYSGQGDNLLVGNAGADWLEAALGDDTVYGGAGNDVLFTGEGYYGATGTEVADAGEGDDFVSIWGLGEDRAEGGAGSDLIHYHAWDDALLSYSASDLTITVTGTTLFLGSQTIATGLEVFYIVSGSGDDTIKGGAGNDTLFGGAGNDTIDGGSGDDYLVGYGENDTFMVDSTGDFVEEQDGWGTNDTVYASVSVADLWTGVENLVLTGTAALNATGNGLDNHLIGTSGDNSLSGRSGNDLLEGGEGHDLLTGDRGDDTLNGDEGNDLVRGGAGNDTLIGGSGADRLGGNWGDDLLTGGGGADGFQFEAFNGAGTDTITDFEVGVDVLVLREVSIDAIEETDLDGTGGLDSRVWLSNGTVVALLGVSGITADDLV